VLVGVYPADVNENAHFLSAILIFGPGSAVPLAAALSRRSPLLRSVRWVSLALGVIAVTGVILFFAQRDLGFGVGGMERAAAFPLLIWALVLGVHCGGAHDRVALVSSRRHRTTR
jgi:hypothetical membrane protein